MGDLLTKTKEKGGLGFGTIGFKIDDTIAEKTALFFISDML